MSKYRDALKAGLLNQLANYKITKTVNAPKINADGSADIDPNTGEVHTESKTVSAYTEDFHAFDTYSELIAKVIEETNYNYGSKVIIKGTLGGEFSHGGGGGTLQSCYIELGQSGIFRYGKQTRMRVYIDIVNASVDSSLTFNLSSKDKIYIAVINLAGGDIYKEYLINLENIEGPDYYDLYVSYKGKDEAEETIIYEFIVEICSSGEAVDAVAAVPTAQ